MKDNQRQTHLAYIAGILDADGCFMITKHNRKTPENRRWKTQEKRNPTYIATVKIGMIEIEAIDFIVKVMKYGKYHLDGARVKRPNSKPIYQWYLRGCKWVKPFLEEVIPFLLIKKERAKFLLEFCHSFKVTKDGYHGIPVSELNYREESYVKNARV